MGSNRRDGDTVSAIDSTVSCQDKREVSTERQAGTTEKRGELKPWKNKRAIQ
jgi:hypothetical protein